MVWIRRRLSIARGGYLGGDKAQEKGREQGEMALCTGSIPLHDVGEMTVLNSSVQRMLVRSGLDTTVEEIFDPAPPL